MPTPNPSLRREYKGAAAATTLLNPMTNTDVSFVLVAANNWPTGSVGKFIVTINRGQADEEKILCDSQTTRTVACLLANRGFDGTTAQAHAAGATVECTISAFDADEWNQHTNATTGVHGVAGAVVGTTDTQVLTAKTLSSPAFTGTATGLSAASATLDAASTIGGVSGTILGTAWTPYSATFTNFTQGNAAVITRYKQVGKTVTFVVTVTPGSTSAYSGIVSVSLPVAAATGYAQNVLAVFWNGTSNDMGIAQILASATTASLFCHLTTGSSALGNFQGTSLGTVVNSAVAGNWNVYGTYEAA